MSTIEIDGKNVPLKKLTVAQLKEQLSSRSLPSSGNKPVLLERLEKALSGSSDEKEESANEEEEEEKEAPKGKKRKSSTDGSASKKKQKTEDSGSQAKTTDFTQPPLQDDEMKIVTWNVASLKAIMGKGFMDYLKNENPDILCLNETKVGEGLYESKFKDVGYHAYFNACKKNTGYSGTAILSKTKPISVTKGIEIEDHDEEGRVITAEYDNFYLVATYIPNAGEKGPEGMPKDLEYRQKWDVDFLAYLVKLKEKKAVIWCGDLNVAHKEVDLTNPKTNQKTAGFTPQERAGFQKVLDSGFSDAFRKLHPQASDDAWTFWSYRNNCRAKNVGWRLDYFVTSDNILPNVTHVYPRTHVLGSDHCPLALHLKKSL